MLLLAPDVCSPADPDASLLGLPPDVQLSLLKLLDGKTLCRYAECTSRELAKMAAPELGELWKTVYRAEVLEASVGVPSAPQDEETPAFQRARAPIHQESVLDGDATACKQAFVRGRSAIEHRCPQCGRQHKAWHSGATPLDDHGRQQGHLCGWLSKARKPRAVVDLS